MRPSFYMRKYWVKPGKKRPLCIRVHRKVPSWVRPSCNAFLSGKSWQYFVAVHPRRGSGQENRPFVARYRRHASKMSWFWQDMLPMYSKCPAKRRWRIHQANILPERDPFRCTDPSNHARRANPAILDGCCRTISPPLNGSRWANPAMHDSSR